MTIDGKLCFAIKKHIHFFNTVMKVVPDTAFGLYRTGMQVKKITEECLRADQLSKSHFTCASMHGRQ
jgi:hypothetical protein